MRHRQEHRSTRSSRSRASALLLIAVAAGCATPGEVTVSPEGGNDEVQKQKSISFQRIDTAKDDLALIYGDSKLYLGVEKTEALEIFKPLDKSLEFSSLPSQFDERNFGAFGWETDGFAVGFITYEQTDPETKTMSVVVVHAMYMSDDVTDDTVQAVLQEYKRLYGEPSSALPGSRIGYWFWTKPGRRLMVNTAVIASGKKTLTVAVGETQVMTLLGMSFEQAKKDKDKAIERLNGAVEP